MIKQLKIKNFRCFKNSLITFKELSVLVGKNNSGKSTIIEALRIISIITNRYKNLKYTKSPSWTSIQTESFGVSPSINNLDISPNNIFHLYGEPPALLEVKFENKMRIETYIGEDADVFAIIYDQDNKEVSTKRRANSIDLPIINILPQISPLLREEKIIKFETVQSNLLTKLSSRNFRNQIRYYNDDFSRFCELAERTWKGLSISNISNLSGFQNNHELTLKK